MTKHEIMVDCVRMMMLSEESSETEDFCEHVEGIAEEIFNEALENWVEE